MQPIHQSESTIRWGILGTAKIASKVARAIQSASGSTVAAVASRSLSRAQDWITAHTQAADGKDTLPPVFDESRRVIAYGDYLELLRDPEIDVVYIPLPPSLHCEWTCRAAEHGKHVLCEKPLGLNQSEARRMIAACEGADVQLMDGVMWRHHDRTAAMRAILDSGELGPLRHLTAAFSFNALKDMAADNIRFQADLGGGVLGDVGWYCVTAALWAFGELPERVFASARYERGVDVSWNVLLWFANNRTAAFQCAFDAVWRKWFEVAGASGSVVCDDFVNPWDSAKARFWVHNHQGQSTQHVSPPRLQEVCMIEALNDIIRSKHLDRRWPRISLETQIVCDAIAESARTAGIIELPPDP